MEKQTLADIPTMLSLPTEMSWYTYWPIELIKIDPNFCFTSTTKILKKKKLLPFSQATPLFIKI